MFSTVRDIVDELECSTTTITAVIESHLGKLSANLEQQFGDLPGEEMDWIRNPMRVEEWNMPLKHLEELTDLQSDRTLMQSFNNVPLDEFWISAAEEYPNISQAACRLLLSFATTYLAETGFSALTYMKSKYRSRLDVEADMRVAVTTNFHPNFVKITSQFQAHPSH